MANLPLDLLPAEPGLPLHGLLTVGTLDPLMPFIGGQVNETQGRVPSSDKSRDVWRYHLGLGSATFEEVLFADISPDNGTVRAEFYESDYGPDFAYYVVDGGGHATPGSTSNTIDLLGFGPTNRDIVAADQILAFLAVRPAIPDSFVAGDFNGDGAVNAADYTVWRDGRSGSLLENNYLAWQAHYGGVEGAISAPEPTAVVLGIVSSIIGALSGRER